MESIFKKVDTEELSKFEEMIKAENLSYTREDYSRKFPGGLGVYDVHQIIGFDGNNKPIWDVVCSTGTRGAEKGLLEFWGNPDSEPIGFLEAERAFDLVKEMAGI
jgi:hypothetical protein